MKPNDLYDIYENAFETRDDVSNLAHECIVSSCSKHSQYKNNLILNENSSSRIRLFSLWGPANILTKIYAKVRIGSQNKLMGGSNIKK